LPVLLKELKLQENLDESSKKCLKNLNEAIQNENITMSGSGLHAGSGGVLDFNDSAFSIN
jgi:hypothetical protein